MTHSHTSALERKIYILYQTALVHLSCTMGSAEDISQNRVAEEINDGSHQTTNKMMKRSATDSSLCSLRWRPTSTDLLAEAERKILKHVWHMIETPDHFVPVSGGTKHIHTISLNCESQNIPLVLVHGMGSGVGLWALNLDSLVKHRPVHAIDVLGFGRSSRPKFSKDAEDIEKEFVQSLEDWRKYMKLERFILLGHSMGAFVSFTYALQYPQYLSHLILVDPWGLSQMPQEAPRWVRAMAAMLSPFNPFGGLRAVGPWGPRLMSRIRPDLTNIFSDLFNEDDDTVSKYLYHCNAQDPSGEIAYKNLNQYFRWAKHPMISRIDQIAEELPITFIHGSRSWLDDSDVAYEAKHSRPNSFTDVQIIKGARHHVYADQATLFNHLVNRICKRADQLNTGSQENVSSHSKKIRTAHTEPELVTDTILQADGIRIESES